MPGFKSRLAHKPKPVIEHSMRAMIKDIIFDMGGVLLEYKEEQYYSYISKKYHLSKPKLSHAMQLMIDKVEVGSMTVKRMRALISKEFGIPNADLEWVRFFESNAKPDNYMVALVMRLKKSYCISILSNVSRSRYLVARRMFIDKLGVYRVFTSCYMGMRKPSERIYRKALKELNARPESTIFIDNLKVNVEGAKRVGIKAIQYRSHAQIAMALERLGVRL